MSNRRERENGEEDVKRLYLLYVMLFFQNGFHVGPNSDPDGGLRKMSDM